MATRLLSSASPLLAAAIPGFGTQFSNPKNYIPKFSGFDPTVLVRMWRNRRPDYGSNVTTDNYQPPDPIQNYTWYAFIPGVLDVGEYIQSITTPSIRFDQQSRFENGKMRHYAGVLSVDDIQLTLYTDVTKKAISCVAEWIASIRDEHGLYSLPKDYRKTVVLYILDMHDRIIAEIHYKDCWITNWSSYSLDYTNSNILVTNVTLSVDDFEIIDGTDTNNGMYTSSTTIEGKEVEKTVFGQGAQTIPEVYIP
jgi:hypothetical protein